MERAIVFSLAKFIDYLLQQLISCGTFHELFIFIFNLTAFIVELCWKADSSLENEKTYPQCKDVKNANLINNNSDTGMDTETSALDEKNRGRIWSVHPK